MLVDIGFPEPVVEDRSEHLKRIIEELRKGVSSLGSRTSVQITDSLSCPAESFLYLDSFEADWLTDYFYKYGWKFSYGSVSEFGQVFNITLGISVHTNFRKKKLEESLCSLT